MPVDSAPVPLPARRHPSGPYQVCMVCLGNICRSPMAEVVLQDELARAGLTGAVEVDSAGTGDWHIGEPMDTRARAELGRRGYGGDTHRARQFQRDWFARYDLILAMDRSNLANLRAMAAGADISTGRVRLFRSFDPALADGADDTYRGEVPDPYGGVGQEYAVALDLVLPAARGLAAALAAQLGVPAPPAQ